MTKTYFNAHAHNLYSLLDGYSRPKGYAQRCKELGMDTMTCTDHGNLYGLLDYYEAAQEVDLKYMPGIEAYQARKTRHDRDGEERSGPAKSEWEQRGPYHAGILAYNYEGYKNLINLSSRAFLEGNFSGKARVDHELIADHSKGLVLLSGCLNGEIPQALLRGDKEFAYATAAKMQEVMGRENYFIEVQNHHIPEQLQVIPDLIDIAKKINAPVVATCDCHYTHRHEAKNHDQMLCVSTGSLIEDEKRFRFANDEFYLKSYDEMAQMFEPQWLDNTLLIAEKADLKLEFGKLYFPEFPLPAGYTTEQYFRKLVDEGTRFRFGDNPSQEVVDRLDYEMKVILEMGFPNYFLVVADLVVWAKENGIAVGFGRGSAAGSLVSYVMRITNLDPLRFGLLFERFLIRGRKSMPDIDLDFDDRYKDKVIDYARQKYGNDHVTHIITFSTIGARAAIRDAARVLGADYALADKVAKTVPPPVMGISKSLEQSMEYKEFRDLYEADEKAKEIIDAARGLEGLVRHTGIHAAGVVISQAPTQNFVPVMQKETKQGGKGPIVTQWDMNRVDLNGLLKIDFLALRNLGVVVDCVENIKRYKGIDVDWEALDLYDDATYAMLRAGAVVGVFQLEGSGMKEMTTNIRPTKIEDIMAVISLFRPGPMGSGMDREFIARKNGKKSVSYAHPKLKDVLHKTYGLMLYQEDVLAVSKHLAGFSEGESDDLRKAVGKKKMDQVNKLQPKFVAGCAATHGVPKHVAEKIFADIAFFGNYGFGLAHAASYALLAYVTAWLKGHYPTEYMAALLTSVANKRDRAALYIHECERLGIQVLPPSINGSEANCRVVDDKTIQFGFSNIAGVGEAALAVMDRSLGSDYKSLLDFMQRAPSELLTKTLIEHYIRSGVFDDIVSERPELPMSRDERNEILAYEKQELALYITDNPIKNAWHYLSDKVSTTIADLQEDGEMVKLGVIIGNIEKKTTKRGQTMYSGSMQDVTGDVRFVVFPKAAMKLTNLIEGEIYLVSGRVALDEGDEASEPTYQIFLDDATKPHIPQFLEEPITITATAADITDKKMEEIMSIIDRTPGSSPVYFTVQHKGALHRFQMKKPTCQTIATLLQEIINESD